MPEAARAWHAGAGEWAGVTDVNSAFHRDRAGKYRAGSPLRNRRWRRWRCCWPGSWQRWAIPAHRVIAHSDMAPSRKGDPGARFDWRRLALQGLSVWPEAARADVARRSWPALRRFGYPDAPEADLLAAFRLRFRPWARGPLDAVDAGLACDLAARFAVDASACAGVSRPSRGWLDDRGAQRLEESPDSMKKGCRVTPGGGNLRESATEKRLPWCSGSLGRICGDGETVG